MGSPRMTGRWHKSFAGGHGEKVGGHWSLGVADIDR